MQFLRLCPGVRICIPGEGGDEGRAVHTDRAVDSPRVDRYSDVAERSTPRINVVVVRVDEGAVDVEEDGRGGLASAGFHERR